MRIPFLLAAVMTVGAATPALAVRHHARTHHKTEPEAATQTGPTAIGHFGDWTAARYLHDGQTICYAFVRAKLTEPATPGSPPLLTVTERATSRDEVAITGGAAYPKDATVTVQVRQAGLDFYTSGANAFARDGHAAAAAMRNGAQAIARGPGPHGSHVTETFSLAGFTAAYDAIVKACPPAH